VLDPDATMLSVTSDVNAWTQIALAEPVEDPLGSLLYGDANGRINVVAVGERPLGAGYVADALDHDSWIATTWVEDSSGALQRVAPWRPLYALGLTFVDLEAGDGFVRLVASAVADAPGAPPVLRVAESSPSAPQPAPTCAPAPLADCTFVTLDGAQLAGSDLGGIQLYGATLNNTNLDGANLQLAQLSRATLNGVSMFGTNLTQARMVATRIGQSSLISTNLDYTDLSAATFIATNLAGASLVGATTDGTTIDATSTCPDQSPPATTGAPVLATACRLR
jgi:hypothetical protein